MEVDNEDSLDAPPSVGSNDSPLPTNTPISKKVIQQHGSSQQNLDGDCFYFQVKKEGGQKKNVTPYILYASEIRKSVAGANKNRSFGEISRIVGDQVNAPGNHF